MTSSAVMQVTASTQPPKSAALSSVTISVPVSMFASTVLAVDGVERSLRAHRAHLGRELGDRRELVAGDDRRDLVGPGVEADDLDRSCRRSRSPRWRR